MTEYLPQREATLSSSLRCGGRALVIPESYSMAKSTQQDFKTIMRRPLSLPLFDGGFQVRLLIQCSNSYNHQAYGIQKRSTTRARKQDISRPSPLFIVHHAHYERYKSDSRQILVRTYYMVINIFRLNKTT